MPEPKTKPDNRDVDAFLASVLPAQRQAEAYRLAQIFSEVSGFAPRIWAGRMVGFGSYDYVYASGHSGQSFATGFAMGKSEISIYVPFGHTDHAAVLQKFEKYRLGKSCLYLRRFVGADEPTLRALIRAGLDDLAKLWPIYPF